MKMLAEKKAPPDEVATMTPLDEGVAGSVTELIKEFEGDIQYDAHSFTARVERSAARRKLQRLGHIVLGPIALHLRAHPPETNSDLAVAWGYLLNRIEEVVDPKKSGPRMLNNIPGWITWAERFAA